jgi:hypothetical protein
MLFHVRHFFIELSACMPYFSGNKPNTKKHGSSLPGDAMSRPM